jgi:WD40 repeat protein/mono/diheme cytochrome c family protein
MRREFLSLALASTLSAGRVDYVRDIQPIFEKRCVMCHSTNATMGSLNLESYVGLQQGGNNGPVVFKGNPGDSTLYRSITGQAPEIGRMPMNNEVMSDQEIGLIRTWIAEGAEGGAAAPKQIYSVSYAPKGSMLAVARYQEVEILDPSTQKEIRKLGGHADAVRALAWSADGSTLVAAGGVPGRKGELKIWKSDGTLAATGAGHADCIYAAAISPDGKTIATASYDKLVKLWDAATGNEMKTLKDHTDAIYSLAFTPDGKKVLSGAYDRTVKVWDAASGERLFTLSEPTDGVNTIALSPDGKFIAAAGQDKTIRVWALEDKQATLKASMIAHEDAILKIAYSPDGRYIVSSSADRAVKVFRATDLTELAMLGKQPDWTFGLSFSPDGRQLALGRMNGSLSITPFEVKP